MLNRLTRSSFTAPAIIAAAAILTYAASLSNGFVGWDDGSLILDNPIVHALTPATIWAAFTTFDPELYVPLTFVSFQLNHLVSGLDPFAYHATNLALHIIASFLVGRLVMALTGRRDAGFAASLLFALHPINTEAVSWISARKDVLSAVFFLLTVLCYRRFRRAHVWRFYGLALLCVSLGLLSKVSVVVAPLALLLLDWYEERPLTRRSLLRLSPFFVLSFVFMVIGMFGKVTGSAFVWEKILLGCRAVFLYLGKLLVPVNFSLLYPYTQPIGIGSPDLLLSLIAVLFVLAGTALLMRRGYRTTAFAVFWFIILLLPTFNSIARGHDELQDAYIGSDRYAYLAGIGVFLLVGVLFARLRERWNAVAWAALVVVALVLGFLANRQSLIWIDTPTLFRHVVAVQPNSHVAHTNVGVALYEEGDSDGAMREFESAVGIRPNGRAYYNIGQIHLLREEPEEAMEAFRQAIKASPVDIDSHLYLALLLINRSRFDEAQSVLAAALDVEPEGAEIYAGFGLLAERQGKRDEAVKAYRRALELDPENADLTAKIAELEEK